MRIKKRLKIIGLLLVVLIACLVGVFSINAPTTAEAATTKKFNVQFDYVNNKIVSTLGNHTTTKYRSGNNVTSASVLNHVGKSMTFRIYMYGDDYSGTATLNDGGYFNSTTANISLSSTYTDHTITIKNSSGTQIHKATATTSTTVTGLANGQTYSVEILCFGIGTGTTIMTRYETTATFTFTVDTTAPTLSGASTTKYDVMSNEPVKVTGSDTGSGVKYIYKKGPNDDSYYIDSIYGTGTVYLDDPPGMYEFYVMDNAYNTSPIYYVYYDAVAPIGTIYNSSGTAITATHYNDAFYYKATDEGFGVSYHQYKTPGASSWSNYTAGTTIAKTATNGTYTFRTIDLLGNVSEEVSIYLDTVAPTGKVYANSAVLSSGGKTNASSIYYTATDTGGIAACYVKAPGSSSYVEYDNSAAITVSGSYSFYSVDHAGNQSSVYTVLMDHDAPVLSCDETEFSDTIGSGFTVRCSDALSGFTFYYKMPNQSTYSSTTSSAVFFPVTLSDGKYYFYAVDALGNTSATVWVELSVDVPSATITKSDTDNKVKATWGDSNVEATLNGIDYVSGTWVSEEGDYTLTLTNTTTGRTAKYTFTIGHYYKCTGTVAPTCTEQGYSIYECISCDSSYYSDFIPANGHTYNETKFNPTCTEQGYTIYVCSVCDYTYIGNYVPAKGHSYEREIVEPTCIERGYTVSTCKDCGYSYTSDYVSPLGHNYVSTDFDATCTEKGGTHYVCTRCGDEYTIYTASELGHHYYTELVEPSCEEEGYIMHQCTECEYEYKTDIKNALGHSYVTWVSSVPDCHHDGSRVHKCQTCGNEYYKTIPCKGHSYAITDAETENGTKRTYACETCGDEYVQYLGDQYVMVSNFVDDLIEQYAPYMFMIFLATAGVWSVAMGVAIILAYKAEDRQKSKRMVKNYCIGLIVIFAILVACPYLVKGIAYLVAH